MVGLRVTYEGQMARVRQAQTLDEVAELAGRLRGAMQRRGVHPQVLAYCEVEVLRQSIFRTVFAATKSLAPGFGRGYLHHKATRLRALGVLLRSAAVWTESNEISTRSGSSSTSGDHLEEGLDAARGLDRPRRRR